MKHSTDSELRRALSKVRIGSSKPKTAFSLRDSLYQLYIYLTGAILVSFLGFIFDPNFYNLTVLRLAIAFIMPALILLISKASELETTKSTLGLVLGDTERNKVYHQFLWHEFDERQKEWQLIQDKIVYLNKNPHENLQILLEKVESMIGEIEDSRLRRIAYSESEEAILHFQYLDRREFREHTKMERGMNPYDEKTGDVSY